MPHVVFNPGSLSAGGEVTPRQLIPGVEPGGQRAGQVTKPALLIRDAFLQVNDFNAGAVTAPAGVNVFLKLSQEGGLVPGLLLPVGGILKDYHEASAVGMFDFAVVPYERFHAQGTVWAPLYVGVFFEEIGTMTWDIDVHLDYERVEVPWMDWFIMWDFLDNIVDNDREY